MQKKSNRFIFSADEKQVGAQPGSACWWIWNRTKPQVYIGPDCTQRRKTYICRDRDGDKKSKADRETDKDKEILLRNIGKG